MVNNDAETLDACVELPQVDGRTQLLAEYVGQIVALCSQDVSKDDAVPSLGWRSALALTFELVDDLTDATQLVGAQLLRHIVRNVTPTELRWYSDVLLGMLHTAMVSRKPATLDVLLDCLVESLDKVSPLGELKHYDRFTPRLLSDTSLCSDVAVRTPYRAASRWCAACVAYCELFEEGADFTPSSKEKEHLLALCEDILDLLHQVNAGNPAVSDMLATVGNQSPKLAPFCDRMQVEWTTR